MSISCWVAAGPSFDVRGDTLAVAGSFGTVAEKEMSSNVMFISVNREEAGNEDVECD